jgi:hypothetical protein
VVADKLEIPGGSAREDSTKVLASLAETGRAAETLSNTGATTSFRMKKQVKLVKNRSCDESCKSILWLLQLHDGSESLRS